MQGLEHMRAGLFAFICKALNIRLLVHLPSSWHAMILLAHDACFLGSISQTRTNGMPATLGEAYFGSKA